MDLLEECLLNRVPVNVVDRTGNTPLHCAARTGQTACLERLLSIRPRVNVNAQNRYLFFVPFALILGKNGRYPYTKSLPLV